MNKKAPTIGKYYDDEERKLIEAIESNDSEFKRKLTPKRRQEVQEATKATMSDKRSKITLRISRTDLVKIKARALREGIPYQTLINTILHQEVNK